MAFDTGLSGLNAASQSLDVIGNNVANSATVGFKQSRTLFSDVFANSLSGSGSNAIGIGTKVAAIEQQFTQGAITVTNNPLDIAVNVALPAITAHFRRPLADVDLSPLVHEREVDLLPAARLLPVRERGLDGEQRVVGHVGTEHVLLEPQQHRPLELLPRER